MAYIGKSPTGTGVRSRYYYTATGGETSLSGADDNSNTLVFSDGNYVDVSLNGIALVAGTDYNTSTANTIAGLSALSASDIVEIVVYDIFTVADTVSAKDGGTFSGNVTMGGTLSVTGASTLTGAATATGGLNVGTIKDATGTNTGISISSAGIITKPQTPAFRVTASAGQALAHATLTKISFDTKTGSNFQFDTGGDYDTTNYHFLAPVTGVYFFKGQFFASVSTGRGGTFILVDTGSGFDVTDTDTYLTQGLRTPSAANGGIVYSSTAVVHLTAGHKVAAYAYQEQGSSTTINATGSLTHFTGYLVG